MNSKKEVARTLRKQEPGRVDSHAIAAGTCNIAQAKGHAKRAGLYRVTPEGGEPFTIEAKGREAWALDRLRLAVPQGRYVLRADVRKGGAA